MDMLCNKRFYMEVTPRKNKKVFLTRQEEIGGY